ncbi:unnamed protein product [Phytophthora fragariaefolia]|uniref:Unnamed protein product n=1 Tax=Phytophthora fragariaefolia TaxID=1490495 RepID=A0A9W6TXT7_9STRA|nr:unnamed protein product [Phytophthora fragariaefolia]
MDLSEIPFDVPVILQSLYMRMNLQNPLGSKKACCLEDNRDVYEQIVLRRISGDKIAIQCVRNGRYLQVRSAGECVFDPKEPGDWELFTMETDAKCALFFVSCHTGNVLQCDARNVVRCVNCNRLGWESWRIVEPRGVNAVPTPVSADQRGILVGKERQEFILELVKHGKSPDEIDQIVSRLFDAPAASTSGSPPAFAVAVDKA